MSFVINSPVRSCCGQPPDQCKCITRNDIVEAFDMLPIPPTTNWKEIRQQQRDDAIGAAIHDNPAPRNERVENRDDDTLPIPTTDWKALQREQSAR